jgi:hypothetical protein
MDCNVAVAGLVITCDCAISAILSLVAEFYMAQVLLSDKGCPANALFGRLKQ